jgi:hypothetical protein
MAPAHPLGRKLPDAWGHPDFGVGWRSANAAISPLRRRKVRDGFGRDDKFVEPRALDCFEGGVEVAKVGVGLGHGFGVLGWDGGGGADGGFAGGGDCGVGSDAGGG